MATIDRIAAAKHALDMLKQRVEYGEVKLTHNMVVGITDNLDSDEILRTTDLKYEDLGTIRGEKIRTIIIYETRIMHQVEFAVYDEHRDACLIVNVDEVIEWMTPTNERALLIQMTRTAESLSQ